MTTAETAGPTGANRLACAEVFGPILSVMPFADEADAVRLANATEFGLVAGIWTRDGARQMRLARAIRCGQIFVSTYGTGPMAPAAASSCPSAA